MLILTEKGFLRPISGLANRLFAGCLQVNFRFDEHCNTIFNPKITRKHYRIPVCQMQLISRIVCLENSLKALVKSNIHNANESSPP
jgi:hypothetical protein